MLIRLRRKYRTYTGDTVIGSSAVHPKAQYGMGRSGNGNGKRVGGALRPTNRAALTEPKPMAMFVDGLSGRKTMRPDERNV